VSFFLFPIHEITTIDQRASRWSFIGSLCIVDGCATPSPVTLRHRPIPSLPNPAAPDLLSASAPKQICHTISTCLQYLFKEALTYHQQPRTYLQHKTIEQHLFKEALTYHQEICQWFWGGARNLNVDTLH
jgi:hypothetical protein